MALISAKKLPFLYKLNFKNKDGKADAILKLGKGPGSAHISQKQSKESPLHKGVEGAKPR